MKTIGTACLLLMLFGCGQPKCEEDPAFYLKDTAHDCDAARKQAISEVRLVAA